MLIISQDEKFTGMVKFLGIGQRNPKTVIGDELKSLLEEKKMTSDELITLVGNKSFQIRLPLVKGLMTPVNYLKFCEETKGASTKIIDLWGKEWDVKKDNIKYRRNEL